MPTKISWLDFSESDRRKMLDLIAQFNENETRDELGLGTVRDAFSNMLFPGTSTIQTRVHYFLFIPWIYKMLEDKRIPSNKFGSKRWESEVALIHELKRSGEEIGVIGYLAGANLKRFPSSIYWIGLQEWGILRFSGHQYNHQRSLDAYYKKIDTIPEKESAEWLEHHGYWDPGLPAPPTNFPRNATFNLSVAEAEYLQHRLSISCRESMLAHLVQAREPVEEVYFAWNHPQYESFPVHLQVKLNHARNFSEIMVGAALLYNLMLSELSQRKDKIETYKQSLVDWRVRIMHRESQWLIWNIPKFWEIVYQHGRIPNLTRKFIDTWISLILDGNMINDPIENENARQLIKDREFRLKHGRSRFFSKRHLELWSGASGTGQLDFRWRVARALTNEILLGLNSMKKKE